MNGEHTKTVESRTENPDSGESEGTEMMEPPPPEWLLLWGAAKTMLQSYGEHRHEGRCSRCNAAWDELHAALLACSKPKGTS